MAEGWLVVLLVCIWGDFPEGCTDGNCLAVASVGLNGSCVCWLVMFWVVLELTCEVGVWVCDCVAFKVVGLVVVCKPGNSGNLLVKSC